MPRAITFSFRASNYLHNGAGCCSNGANEVQLVAAQALPRCAARDCTHSAVDPLEGLLPGGRGIAGVWGFCGEHGGGICDGRPHLRCATQVLGAMVTIAAPL